MIALPFVINLNVMRHETQAYGLEVGCSLCFKHYIIYYSVYIEGFMRCYSTVVMIYNCVHKAQPPLNGPGVEGTVVPLDQLTPLLAEVATSTSPNSSRQVIKESIAS